MNDLKSLIVRQELRSNHHLRDIINATNAEVEFPTEVDVEIELALKRLYSVHNYDPLRFRTESFESL